MYSSKIRIAVLLLPLFIAFSSMAVRADFVLYSNYEFNGSLSDSLGNSDDFAAIGLPELLGSSLHFGEFDGLALSTPVTSADYRIELDISLSSLGRWNKLIDFKDRSNDFGLYIDPNDSLRFYGFSSAGSDTLFANTQYTVALEKIGFSITGYLNGIGQFSFTDPNVATAATGSLTFFVDDFATSGEGAVGSVGAIRLYTQAVPEPSTVALVLFVGCLSSVAGRSRSILKRLSI